MDTTSRGWKLTRVAREGGKTTHSHGRCQIATENDGTTRKDQIYRGDENFTSRGKGSTSVEDDVIGSVGAPTRKGKTTGHQDRHIKIECRAPCSGRSTAATKPSHPATHGRYG
jgi:hypothetical protein